MMPSVPSQLRFELPGALPNLQAKVSGSNKYDMMTKPNIERAITAILNKNGSQADGIILLRFLHRMAKDPAWIQTNMPQAELIMRATTMVYINTDESSVAAKIRRIVQEKSTVLALCTRSDLNITFSSSDVPACQFSSLFLACQSPVFDRMFRGHAQEAVSLRQSYACSSTATTIKLHVNPDIFKIFLDMIATGKNSKRPKLHPDKEAELMSYVDMTDSLTVLLRAQEDIVFSHMTPDVARQVFDLLLQQESRELEKCKKHGLPLRDPKQNAEMRFIKNLNHQNALVLYDMAQAKGLKLLAIQALDLIVSNVSLRQAYEGAITGILKGDERAFSGDEVKQVCFNWFLKRLPQAFQTLDHKIPSEGKSFLEDPVEFCRHSLQSMKISSDVQSAQAHSDANQFIDKFIVVIAHIRVVSCSALQELTEKELLWLLKQLPTFICELDLSGCKFTAFDLLKKFNCLRVLNLSGLTSVRSLKPLHSLRQLEQLHVSGCKNLCEVDITPFTRLAKLNLTGCDKVSNIDGLMSNRTLQSVIVDSRLQPLLQRHGFD